MFAGVETWPNALASGAIRVDGPPALAKRLPKWFLGSPFADDARAALRARA